MKKILLVQIFGMIVLFYTGLHLYEQQTAVLEGLRPDRDTYNWAGTTFSLSTMVVALLSIFTGFKTLSINKIESILLITLSLAAFLYSIMVLTTVANESMNEILYYMKFYIISGLWLGVFLFFAPSKLEHSLK